MTRKKMNIETRGENTPEFIEAAETAAMGKVIDIHRDPSLKHGFVRFGPLVVNRNPRSLGYNESQADKKVDRLEEILRYGLVAKNFARKAGIPLSRNWSDSVNENGISLQMSSIKFAFELGVAAATHWINIKSKIQKENIYALLIKHDISKKRKSFLSPELIRRQRVAPRFFKGIVILDKKINSSNTGIDSSIIFESSTTQEAVGLTVEEMESAYKDHPSLCLPVYGLSGALYWPRHMSYQEVQNFVKERGSNGI